MIGCRCSPRPGPKAIYVCKAVGSVMQRSKHATSEQANRGCNMHDELLCMSARKQAHKQAHRWAGKQANENMIFIYELYTTKIQHSCFRGGSLVESIAVFLLFPTSFSISSQDFIQSNITQLVRRHWFK